MRVQEQNLTVETQGKTTSRAFGFEFSPQMADILSKKIYSDPIFAVCREYVANAVDAHVECGNMSQVPKIVVPDRMSPYWSVRDYGRGLSQFEIMGDDIEGGLFNTYGKSGKTHTNAQIGGFGMGSKAGFAYVDRGGNFTVTSYLEGTMSTYACHKGEDGIPVVTKMAEVPTKEPNGIEIKIPVRTPDISSFIKNSIKVCTYLALVPKIIGVESSKQPKKPEYSTKGVGWGFLGRDSYGSSHAVIGGIAYKIDTSSMNLKYSDPGANILSRRFNLYFEVGELELSVSREGLSYDDKTIKALTDRAKVVHTELRVNVEAEFKTCKNMFEATEMYHNKVQNGAYSSIWDLVKNQITFRGRKIKQLREYELVPFTCKADLSWMSWYTATNRKTMSMDWFGQVGRKQHPGAARDVRYPSLNTNPLSTKIIIIDQPAKYLQKLKYNIDNRHPLFDITSGVKCSEIVFVRPSGDIDKTISRMRATLGGIPMDRFVLLSSLDDVPKSVVVGNKAAARVNEFRSIANLIKPSYNYRYCSSSSDASGWWHKGDDIDMAKGGIYVFGHEGYVVKDPKATDKDTICSPLDLHKLMLAMKKSGLLDGGEPVYYINSTYHSWVTKTYPKKWRSIWDVLKEGATKHKVFGTPLNTRLLFVNGLEAKHREFCNMLNFEFKDLLKILTKGTFNDPLLQGIVKSWGALDGEQANQILDMMSDYSELLTDADIIITPTGKAPVNTDVIKKLLDKHPILNYIDNSNFRDKDFTKNITDYLNR